MMAVPEHAFKLTPVCIIVARSSKCSGTEKLKSKLTIDYIASGLVEFAINQDSIIEVP